MKKAASISLAAILAILLAFGSYLLGEKRGRAEFPPVGSGTTESPQGGERPPEMGDKTYIDDMSAEEISQFLRGKVFIDYPHASAGWGETVYFAPQGNEYYWFCSTGDAQSRLRAAYGAWAVTDGLITLTTQKLIEREGGHYVAAYASYGSRFVLEDYDVALTQTDIIEQANFRMFRYVLWTEGDGAADDVRYEMGFTSVGGDYYYNPSYVDTDRLKEFYENYFSLFET